MQARIKRDLPVWSSLSMLVGSNPLCTTLKAHGSKLQVSSGTMETLTTTSNKIMKKSQAATREDVCPLPVATMINRWITTASIIAQPPLKRHKGLYRIHYMNRQNGSQTWETPSPTFSRTSSSIMRTRATCSRISTSIRHTNPPRQTSSLGEGIPRFI